MEIEKNLETEKDEIVKLSFIESPGKIDDRPVKFGDIKKQLKEPGAPTVSPLPDV